MSDPVNPTPPMPPASPAPMPQNGMGTAALVMGILQFFCLGTIGSILAIVFGKIGMNRAKAGLATNGGSAKAGFWLGIVGLILSVITIIVLAFVIGFGAKAAVDSIDPANNARTGLSDGNYAMQPNTSLRINDRCSFGGTPINMDTNVPGPSSISVVGQGPVQCAGDGTPSAVYFTVTSGVAEIVGVE